MTNRLDLYKCTICDNLVEVVLSGEGTLVCCGEDMEKLSPKTVDEMAEKHVPVIEVKDQEVTIRVGSIPHPMEESHYIQFVEAISEDNSYIKRKYLKPGDAPEMKFKCNCSKLSARELCNIHGLWASNN